MTEPPWLEPYPDLLLEGIADLSPGPDARYESKEAVTLAFITFLQHLAPHQRAVLVLRDVLGYPASEVASMLDTSEASVNSALQRARATLESRTPLGPSALERAPLPGSAVERDLLGQFADAFDDGDTDRIVALLTDEALLTMPPEPGKCDGKEAISAYLHDLFALTIDRPTRLVPTRANGQPAFGRYIGDSDTPIARFNCLLVLTLDGNRISRLTRFADTGILPAFGLPRVLR
jgi:RNA polymerase sigma-70 factor (ECF subfamily)